MTFKQQRFSKNANIFAKRYCISDYLRYTDSSVCNSLEMVQAYYLRRRCEGRYVACIYGVPIRFGRKQRYHLGDPGVSLWAGCPEKADRSTQHPNPIQSNLE